MSARVLYPLFAIQLTRSSEMEYRESPGARRSPNSFQPRPFTFKISYAPQRKHSFRHSSEPLHPSLVCGVEELGPFIPGLSVARRMCKAYRSLISVPRVRLSPSKFTSLPMPAPTQAPRYPCCRGGLRGGPNCPSLDLLSSLALGMIF